MEKLLILGGRIVRLKTMKSKVKIGRFNSDNMQEMVEICRELVPRNCDIEHFTQNYCKIRNYDNCYIVAATLEGHLVGTATGTIITALDGNFMAVENVIISEEHRGQGIGKMIMKELDKFASDNDCGYAILVSSDFRKKAHKFYESVGFDDDVRGFRKVY